MELHGIGPSGAARRLVEVGDITRFPDRDRFASWNGPAPIDACSGDQVRHRLPRAGNRQINRVLHIMATVQLRNSGLLRQYLPRTLDFRTLTQADFDAIADELNGRPRQTLGFKTPSQALAEVLR
jgi:transposase